MDVIMSNFIHACERMAHLQERGRVDQKYVYTWLKHQLTIAQSIGQEAVDTLLDYFSEAHEIKQARMCHDTEEV